MPQSPFSGDQNSSHQTGQDVFMPPQTDSLTRPMASPDYLRQIDPKLLSNLNTSQIQEIRTLINQTIAYEVSQKTTNLSNNFNQSDDQNFARKKRKSKLIDIRFVIDLLFSRFYVVLMVGKDVRKDQRRYPLTKATKAGNMIAAFILVVAMNLLISAVILLSLYLLKSALSIDLMPGHFSEQLEILKK